MAEKVTDLDRLSPFAAMESMMDENVSVKQSRIVELFGDRYDGPRSDLSGGELSDLQVAHQTALLLRGDLCFEGVLNTAKDRIRWLSRQLEIAQAALSTAPASPPSSVGEEATISVPREPTAEILLRISRISFGTAGIHPDEIQRRARKIYETVTLQDRTQQ